MGGESPSSGQVGPVPLYTPSKGGRINYQRQRNKHQFFFFFFFHPPRQREKERQLTHLPFMDQLFGVVALRGKVHTWRVAPRVLINSFRPWVDLLICSGPRRFVQGSALVSALGLESLY